MVSFGADVAEYDPLDIVIEGGERGWRIDEARVALLVHDLLPYYVDVLPERTRATVVAETRRLVDWAREQGIPLIASAPRPASTTEQRGLGGRLWGIGPTPAEAATFCLDTLDGAVQVAKRSYSAFFATDLAVELRRLHRDQLLIAGVFASAGILATTFDALAHDIEAFVAVEATADYDRARHEAVLRQIRATTGEVVAVAELLRTDATVVRVEE